MKLRREQIIFIVMMTLALAIIVASAISRNAGGTSSATAIDVPATQTATAINAANVVVEIASSNTKEDWVNAVIERFNAEAHTIESGETIFVRATFGTSGGKQRDILNGTLL